MSLATRRFGTTAPVAPRWIARFVGAGIASLGARDGRGGLPFRD